jgi:hypothetical protein
MIYLPSIILDFLGVRVVYIREENGVVHALNILLKIDRFPKISKDTIKDALGSHAARLGQKEADKKWVLK